MKTPKVLLISRVKEGTGYLYRRFQMRGCDCKFATSVAEARELLQQHAFDLVLSPDRLRDENMFGLMELLEGTTGTLFYSHVTEDGSYWVPAYRNGEKVLGAPALRPSELVIELDALIADLKRTPMADIPLPAPEPAAQLKKPAQPWAPAPLLRKAAS